MCDNGCCKCSNGEKIFCPLNITGTKKYPESHGLTEEEKKHLNDLFEQMAEAIKRLSK